MITPSEIAALGTASAAVIGVTLSIAKFWMSRMDKKMAALISTTRADLLRAIGNNIEKQFEHEDKTTYVTLDYRMDGDVQCLRIPLAYNRITECLQGMRLQLVEHTTAETVYSISTLGYHSPIRLHWHYHEERESIQIIKGFVIDVDTNRKYGPGETWSIKERHRHIVDFSNCFALVTIKPPLPYASTHPIQLAGIAGVYESPEPQFQPA